MNNDRRHFCSVTFAFAASAGALRTSPAAAALQSEDTRTLGRTTNLRYAVNIEMWGFGTKDPVERVRRAADLGFTGVEMWPWRGKDIAALARVSRELGVEIVQFTGWGFVPGLNDPKNHDAFTAEIAASCATAETLGTKLILVVAGNDQPGMTQAEMHQHVIDGLRRAVPIAEKHGVTLILEPMNVRVDHKGHCLYGSADAVRICREVGSPMVKINWDLYHMQISEGDLCGRLREGFDQLGYVQLADHPGRREPGTGEVHYPRVMRELWDLGYRDIVGAECWAEDGDHARAAARLKAAGVW